MEQRKLGDLFSVSALTLGGGGIGGVWGETNEKEAITTIKEAVEAGITLFDVAPMYKNAETLLGKAFSNGYPDQVQVGTKCLLGHTPPELVASKLEESLAQSRKIMKRDHIDIFLLHGIIVDDSNSAELKNSPRYDLTTPWSTYIEQVAPAMQALKESGQIGAWGITAGPKAEESLEHAIKPDAVHAITNLLNSSGSMHFDASPDNPQSLVDAAHKQNVGVLGVRAVAAGALVDQPDRPFSEGSIEAAEFASAKRFRQLAQDWGESAASLAHRYALAMDGVDSVVLGVKNLQELRECLEAEAKPRLSADEMAEIRQSIDHQ